MFGVAWSALCWALRFYGRHLPLVLGLSAIPAVERLLVVSPGGPMNGPIVLIAEVVVTAARVALIAFMLRVAVREVIDGRRRRAARAWQTFTQGITPRLFGFLGQFLLLGVAFVIFDVLPGVLISRAVADGDQAWAQAILLAVKNPTVIALTFAWLVGVARAYMLLGRQDAEQPSASTAG